ncbi:MAG TPA: hypothetical protein VIJ42_15025 [Stellaceae bacterium]
MTANDKSGGERFPEDAGDIKNGPSDQHPNLPHANENAGENEGEGNKSADRRYRDGVARTVAGGHVEEEAKEAERAIDGKEGAALRQAEEAGKKRSHGEDPALNKTKH